MLAGCAGLLFGPLWDTAAGDNPLLRPPGPDYGVIVRLGMPTLALALTLVATLVWASRVGGSRPREDGQGHGGPGADAH